MARRDVYFFITDENKKYYRANQSNDGNYVITKNSQPYPIVWNPDNVVDTELQFATNREYFGMVRTITTQYNFIKDGAAILRHLYYNGKATQEKAYLTAIRFNGVKNLYELSYSGKFDFTQKMEDPKAGIFTCPLVDDSTWGVLSRFDDVEYSLECSPINTKAIPVLIDGINLKNKYTYQTVQAPITKFSSGFSAFNIPMVLINEDGDSVGIVAKDNESLPIPTFLASPDHSGFFETRTPVGDVKLTGSFSWQWNIGSLDPSGVIIYFQIKGGNFIGTPVADLYYIYNYVTQGNLIQDKIYTVNFDILVNMPIGAELFFVVAIGNDEAYHPTITPIITSISVTAITKADPQVVYGLRAIDFGRQLAAKATQNRYTINSNFLVENNKDVCLSGDSIRGVQNAKIISNFKDFYKTFSSIYFLAMRNIEGEVWLEKATETYKNSGNLIDLGDIIDLKIKPANEFMVNKIIVGSQAIDYRHPSGRLEFNSTNSFSMNILDISGQLDIVSRYRLGCFDIQFLIIDYRGQSTQDNSGDNKVYVVKITDELGYATDAIENFEEFTVNSAPLAPIIKSPLNNDIISNTTPIIRGIAPPGSTVNIYADNVLDGGTISDVNGNFAYELVNPLTHYEEGVTDGIHIIDATFTDELAPKTTISLLIDDRVDTGLQIIYPGINASLYNNLPLIKGVAQVGTVVNIELDGVLIATVGADASCKWEYKMTTPIIPNGTHTIVVNSGADTVTFFVEAFTSSPLITYIGSELDGFPIIDNTPLVRGVGIPGTVVNLWLNFIPFKSIDADSAPIIIDGNGNWEFQTVPVNYPDPVTGIPVVMVPIQNGLNILSTSLSIQEVKINVYGYLLSRPPYSSITGVLDNTVFNTEYSPKRMLQSWYPMLASIEKPTPNEYVRFQKADKNGNLRTVLDGVVVQENLDIPVSQLGQPLMLLETGVIRTKANESFAKTLENFNNGGLVRCTFRGNELFFLPIGSMKIKNITSDVQEWSLVMSPLTSYQTLLNLYKNGLTVNIMTNALHHSDYNTLHFVTYDFQKSPKYNNKELYDDWFNNRNEAWLYNPDYIQKMQRTDPLKDQILNNGLSNIFIDIYRCKDAFKIASIPYLPVTPAPVPPPYVLLEATIDLSLYPEDQYFTILRVGEVDVAIAERFETRDVWPGTILIEATNSLNKPNFCFSTGMKSVLRVEGLVKKLQPLVVSNIAVEESGDVELLYSLNSRFRELRFGTAYGLPDYLYLRMADYVALDGLKVEGVSYSLDEGEKVTPSDDVDGHPLYYYNVKMRLKDNINGKTFGVTGAGSSINSVVIVVDATAFGLPEGSLANIELLNEPF